MVCTKITAAPSPSELSTRLLTARNEHIPRKYASRMFSTKIWRRPNSSRLGPSARIISLLRVARQRALHPHDHPEQDERARGEDHQTVVGVAGLVGGGRNDLVAEHRARAEQLTRERHRDDDPRVAQAVADPVEQRAPRWVAHRERLEPPHHDAVGD